MKSLRTEAGAFRAFLWVLGVFLVALVVVLAIRLAT